RPHQTRDVPGRSGTGPGAARAPLHPAPAGALPGDRARSALEHPAGQRRHRTAGGGAARAPGRWRAGRQRHAAHVSPARLSSPHRQLGADRGGADPGAAPRRPWRLRRPGDATAAGRDAVLPRGAGAVAHARSRRVHRAVPADRVPQGRPDAPLLHRAHQPGDAPRHHAAGAAHRVVLSGRRGHRAGDAAVECAMPRINESYLNLRSSYLFAEIRRRQEAFVAAHPDVRVIDLGVGDVTRPLPPAGIGAIHEAAEEMARPESFRGYGPYVGYEFLRSAIAAHDFAPRGVTLAPDEIFVSDGGKSDSANLQEIFAGDCVVALMDPVYHVYADSNVVAGR